MQKGKNNFNLERDKNFLRNIFTRLRSSNARRIFVEEFLRFSIMVATLYSWLCLIDFFFPLNRLFRQLTLIILGLLLIYSLFYIFKETYRTYSDGFFATLTEKRYPEFSEKLISASYFKEWDGQDFQGISKLLVEDAIEDAAKNLRTKELKGIFELGLLKKRIVLTLFAGIFASMVYFISPEHYLDFYLRLKKPFKEFISPKNKIIKVIPGNISIEEGKPLQISCFLKSPLLEKTVVLVLESEMAGGGKKRRWGSPVKISMKAGTKGDYHHTLLNVSRSYRYYFLVSGITSEKYIIDVEKKGRILNYQVSYKYPGYTNLPELQLPPGTYDIEALENTKIQILFTVNKPLKSAKIYFFEKNEAKSQPFMDIELFADSANNYLTEFNLSKDYLDEKYYKIELTDKKGKRTIGQAFYRMKAQKDQSPQIEIYSPDPEIPLPKSRIVKVSGMVEDDYGIFEVLLHYRVNARREWKDINLKPERFDQARSFKIEFPFALDT
ncbi:hypothetical protein ACFL35_00840, partial [Candidatus Riflebacteria bacterium]